MKLAVMQPYLFPYIGYYQLAYEVDKFVFYDDVNFIKGGYINRNNILINGKKSLFTIPVLGGSPNKLISELNFDKNVTKQLKTIEQAYSKAPHFSAVFPMIQSVFLSEDRSISEMAGLSIKLVFDYLDIKREFLLSSQIENDKSCDAKDRLIDMSKLLECEHYINSPGGKELYQKAYFSEHGIELGFIESNLPVYKQGVYKFIPYLSMIDVLMWCSKDEIKLLLADYKVV